MVTNGFLQVSISSMFFCAHFSYENLFGSFISSYMYVKNNVCTKNLYIKCWWNLRLYTKNLKCIIENFKLPKLWNYWQIPKLNFLLGERSVYKCCSTVLHLCSNQKWTFFNTVTTIVSFIAFCTNFIIC